MEIKMKRAITIFLFTLFSNQIFFINEVSAAKTINISGWVIEFQEDGTCALGKTYEYGEGDALIVAITSFGQVSMLADKPFYGSITIDNKETINSVHTLSPSMYLYSNSDNVNNGKILIKYFKKGSTAQITMKNEQKRSLSLKGFTNAYKRYAKCAR